MRTGSFALARRLLLACATLSAYIIATECMPRAAVADRFTLPVGCELGVDCFVQQYPDMMMGDEAIDPFGGHATYDGHNGLDIRLRSTVDIARGVSVIAMADGKVLRWRDGASDRLVMSEADRTNVDSKECGNGVVVDHGAGIEAQYCHLRQDSVVVRSGQEVKRGQKLGEIGASGLVQFPHLHITVRRDGAPIDPITGKDIGEGSRANATPAQPLFASHALEQLGRGEPQLLSLGFSEGALDHGALTKSRPPNPPTSSSRSLVGWAWLINLRQDDRIAIRIIGPTGAVLTEQLTQPLERAKASYLSYAGKKGAPTRGRYTMTVAVLRDEVRLVARTTEYEIR